MPATLMPPVLPLGLQPDGVGGDEIVAATRREVIVGGSAFAALTVLGACGDEGSSRSSADGEGRWTFTDDRGVDIRLPRRPERIVSYVGTAAVLWDFGIRPIGVFGPQRREDGTPEPAAGRLDLDSVVSVGEVWEAVNLEALAELRPDLVISGGTDSPWVIADQLDLVEEIAPVALVEVYGAPARTIIGNYERLAVALGADLRSDELQAAQADFDEAADQLATVTEAKPNLTVIATYANEEGLFVAKPADFPDLLEFQELGVHVVEPEGPDEYWVELSWEEADRYPADVIIHDIRSYSEQPDQLADRPTWAALPAVEAGQVGAWSAETVLSYQGFAATFRDLAALLEQADPTVA